MREIATLSFIDIESNDDAWLFVGYDKETVSLGLSLRRNGDIDVTLNKESAAELIKALVQATANSRAADRLLLSKRKSKTGVEDSITIRFKDIDSGNNQCAVVRHGANHIGLCLSINSDIDSTEIPVLMPRNIAKELLESLKQAVDIMNS